MEITCQRCQTEYDFDDALVSERGTTVRCTSCGEQFKVFRAPSSIPERWVVNRLDGRELVFTNLRDLQQAIVNVQVGKHDTLTRGFEAPRPLGSIAELEPFFLDRTGHTPLPVAPPPPPPPRAKIPAQSGQTGRPPAGGPPVPPPPYAPEALLSRHEPPSPSAQSFASTLDDRPPAARHETLRPGAGAVRHDVVWHPDPAVPVRVSSSAPPPDDLDRVDQEQWYEEPRFASVAPRRSRALRWIVLLTFLGVLGLAGATVGRKYVPLVIRPPTPSSHAEDRVEGLLDEANKALAEGDLETAKESLDKASVLTERDARVFTGLARVDAVRADADWLKVRLLPADQPDLAAAARRQAERSAQRALKLAERAAELAPDDAKVALAKIDALRLSGDLAGARALVPRVSAIASQPETAFVLAALDLAEPTQSWPAMVDRLTACAAGEPTLQRAHAALVYALVRAGDLQAAKAELDQMSQAARPYPNLAELSAFVGRAAGGASTVHPAASAAPVRADSAKREWQPAASPQAIAERSEADLAAADYRALLERAAQAAALRQYDKAERFYRVALVKNPGDTEALGGLGDVARARGNSGLARTYYEQVLSRNPHYLPSMGALADLEWEAGDRASAVKRYAELIEISPGGALGERARARIAESQQSSSSPRPVAPPAPVERTPSSSLPPSDLPPGVDTSDLPELRR